MTVVYAARRILTMNPSRPEATHVAVRDGRILGVGSMEELAGWGASTVDTRFAGKVLMPGLVEGHSHLLEGTYWRYAYCGYFDRTDPDGKEWPGVKSIEALVERLLAFGAKLAEAAQPISGWPLALQLTVDNLLDASYLQPGVRRADAGTEPGHFDQDGLFQGASGFFSSALPQPGRLWFLDLIWQFD